MQHYETIMKQHETNIIQQGTKTKQHETHMIQHSTHIKHI